MGTALFIGASAILAVLGFVHGVLTIGDLRVPSSLTPTDSRVREAMVEARMRLAPQVSIWLAWLGFNLSHSLGLLGLGAVGVALGLVRSSLGAWRDPVHVFFVLISLAYLVLAIRFWFRVPAIGMGVATACFCVAWLIG